MINSNKQKNPLAALPYQVERIYVTRGDNLYNDVGVKCDKFMGVMIKGKIHWLASSFTYVCELEHQLNALNVTFCPTMRKWGVRDTDGVAWLNNNITTVKPHHDDMFDEGSYYAKHTKQKRDGDTWWTLWDIIDTYFTVDSCQQAPA